MYPGLEYRTWCAVDPTMLPCKSPASILVARPIETLLVGGHVVCGTGLEA